MLLPTRENRPPVANTARRGENAVQIDSVRHPPEQVAAYRRAGYWTDTTTVDLLERHAREQPDRLALIDARVRLNYAAYERRSRQLAGRFIELGLTGDDVIAVQLPNWIEFAVVVNAAMIAGIPFCQVHSDFRAREIEFVLRYTGAAVFICPVAFRRFDYPAMVRELHPALPALRHVMAVGADVPEGVFDLRAYLDGDKPLEVPDATLLARRPHGDDLARVAFTSATTGDPKAVLHLHNTTNSAVRFANRGHGITRQRRADIPARRTELGVDQRPPGAGSWLHGDHAGRVRRGHRDAVDRARACHLLLLRAGTLGCHAEQP
jgi:non-ribosomal peptide synthetase component E (peptide arylation enzyme)